MGTELLDMARSGLAAWQAGDVDALSPLLDPEVELSWWEPGEWDCHGREAVLSMLCERVAEGAGAGAIELIDAGEDAIVATRVEAVPGGSAAGSRPATLIVFRNGLAITMRQFRDREEALAAAPSTEAPQTTAEKLRTAFDHGDQDLLASLLDPAVRWGGDEETPETCHSRGEVLAWYAELREAGVSATVEELIDGGDVVVLGMVLDRPESGRLAHIPAVVYQVFKLAGGKVIDIRGFPEREEALSAIR